MKKNLQVLLFFALLTIAASVVTGQQPDSTFSASIISNPITGSIPLTVQFSVNSTTQITSYDWDLNGDGSTDSTTANPTFTYTSPGNYLVRLNVTDADGNTAIDTKTIVVTTAISLSLTASPKSGTAPLTVQFTAVATGQDPIQYNWDFDGDSIIDDTVQNPKATFKSSGTYQVKLTAIDATGNSASKSMNITVTLQQTNVELVSYFPNSVEINEQQAITFIIKNDGNDVLTNLDGKLIGSGIQHISSSEISRLNPGEQDSITVQAKFLQQGNVSATIKILDKSIPVRFAVGQGVSMSAAELQSELESIREKAQSYENEYVQKKSNGYLVEGALDNIETARNYIKTAQEALLQNKLSTARLNMDLAKLNLDDAKRIIDTAPKQKLNIAAFFRENALAITATIAALAAVSGIIMKLVGHAKTFGEKMSTVVRTHKLDIVKKGKRKKPSRKVSKKVEPKHEMPDENKQE